MSGVTNQIASEQRQSGCGICKTFRSITGANFIHKSFGFSSAAAKIPQRFIVAGMTFLVFVVQIFSIYSFSLPLTQMVQPVTSNGQSEINGDDTCPFQDHPNSTSDVVIAPNVSQPQ